MVILELPERKASRQRLGRMIHKLRRATQELAPLTSEQIAAADRKRCQEPVSAPTDTRDSARGGPDFRTGFAPVGPFVHRSSLPSIQEMAPDTCISSGSHPLFC
jgi:hypothetical protein